jgi:hypothetical protein
MKHLKSNKEREELVNFFINKVIKDCTDNSNYSTRFIDKCILKRVYGGKSEDMFPWRFERLYSPIYEGIILKLIARLEELTKRRSS